MLDYEDQISDYLKANFSPSCPNKSNFNQTTRELLAFLFQTFPIDCISDYQLNEILLGLGYERHNVLIERTIECSDGKGKEKREYFRIEKMLTLSWCMRSPFNLEPEEIATKL